MTFEEKLDRARTGSRAAYESLCLSSLDKLYTAAVIALKNEKLARSTVISAIADGYAGISRIRDERHLRSWLVHELTKNAVEKLKELKADGVSHTAAGVFAETGRLPDVERLVFSVSCAFGYGSREISVLTGMTEDTVNEKLGSAKKRLGAAYESVCSAAESFAAPESLRERYTGFDESAARIGISEAAKAPEPQPEEHKPAEHKPEEHKPAEHKPEEHTPAEHKPEEHTPAETAPEPESAPEAHAAEAAPTEDEAVAAEEPGEDDESVFSEDDEPFDDDGYYDEDEGGYETGSPAGTDSSRGDETPAAGLNAETFIAVVSAEKMKGSEFLRLIGNTRISNSAYREIEQNPHLTKKRLIALLEGSPLTETDYYKLLTAVKNRREVLNAKEENRLALERAGLYDGSRREKYKRKRREKPKTELELAIGIGRERRPVQPLTFEQSGMEDDDTDFQLQNSTGSFEQQKILSERRKKERLQQEMDLGSVINNSYDENGGEAVDPMSHTALHNIFDENNDEPIDPFAALDANATGKPSMPDRIDVEKNEWILGAKTSEPDDKPEPDSSVGTMEFSVSRAEPSASDTRPFDIVDPEKAWNGGDPRDAASDIMPEEEEAIAATSEEFFGKPEKTAPKEPLLPQPHEEAEPETVEEEEITTIPVKDSVSVTQIISEYAIGEAVSDEEAERAFEPDVPDTGAYEPDIAEKIPESEETHKNEESREHETASEEANIGFAPEVGLVFDAASNAMDSDETEDLSFSFDDKDDDDDDYDEPTKHTAPEKHTPKQPEPAPAPEPRRRPEKDIYDDPDDDSEDEPEGRKRYKGNEYFIDDNEYYEGVNRGKIIACAVLAVLLAAGSAGMKYLPLGGSSETVINDTSITSESEVTETSPVTEPVNEQAVPEEITLTKLSSYDDLTSGYESTETASFPVSGYLRASAEPYSTAIVAGGVPASALITDETVYVYSAQNDCTFRAFPVGEQTAAVEVPAAETEEEAVDTDTDDSVAAEPVTDGSPKTFRIDEKLLYAYTSIGGDLYVIGAKADASGNELYETQVYVFAKDLTEKAVYSVSGKYTGAGIVDGKLVIAASSSPAEYTAAYNNGHASAKHPYYTENGELHEISAQDIYAIDGASHNAVNMIYTVGGRAPLVVVGGTGGAVRFGGYDMTLVVPDGDMTYGIDIAKDLQVVSAKAYPGSAFSADCIAHGGMIGQTESGICAYKNGKSVSVPDEKASSVAWSDKGIAYVVTEQEGGGKMLYGFDMSGDAPESAVISASDIYTDKLIKAGDGLAGLKAEPAADGERAGLRLSLYEYDGELKETSYSIIELDKETPRENLKYLSSPAETQPSFICTNEDGTLFAVPTIYFDGYSEVERVVLLKREGALFSLCGEYITYDEKSSVICAAIRGDKLYIVTDTKVTETEITE